MANVKQVKDILETAISIPIAKPLLVNQGGTWSIVYPAEWTKKRKTKWRKY